MKKLMQCLLLQITYVEQIWSRIWSAKNPTKNKKQKPAVLSVGTNSCRSYKCWNNFKLRSLYVLLLTHVCYKIQINTEPQVLIFFTSHHISLVKLASHDAIYEGYICAGASFKNLYKISLGQESSTLFQPRDPLINIETEQGPPDLKKKKKIKI